jgi:hypothetical protein
MAVIGITHCQSQIEGIPTLQKKQANIFFSTLLNCHRGKQEFINCHGGIISNEHVKVKTNDFCL